MAAKIVAIVGTYRKGRVIDAAVSEVLKGAEAHGAQTWLVNTGWSGGAYGTG